MVEPERDLPLTFNFTVPNALAIEEQLQRLGVAKASKRRAKARLSLLAEAVRGKEAGLWVSYSRWKNAYTGLARYHGTGYSYRVVTGLIEEALAYGLVDEIRAAQGEHRKRHPRQSRFQATDALLEVFRGATIGVEEHEVIRLRNADGRLVDYVDTAETMAMRAQCQAFNAYLASVSIQVTANDLERRGRYIVVGRNGKQPCYIPEGPVRLHRSFNRSSFTLGGRFYGWFQNLPKAIRNTIRLNGHATTELDYSQLHATLLYAEKGKSMESTDAYAIAGFPRDEVKLAFNVAINAPTTFKAIGAVQHNLGVSRSYAASLVRAVKAAHPTIKDMFCTDAGIRLMYTDSQIMAATMTQLIDKNIVFLPVHDSVIVPQKDQSSARDIMIAAFRQHVPGTEPVIKH